MWARIWYYHNFIIMVNVEYDYLSQIIMQIGGRV